MVSIRGLPCAIGRTPRGVWWGLGQAESPDGGRFALYASDMRTRGQLLSRLEHIILDVEALASLIARAPELGPLLTGVSSVVRSAAVQRSPALRRARAWRLASLAASGDVAPLVGEANRALVTFTDAAMPRSDRCAAESCYRELVFQAAQLGVPVIDWQRSVNTDFAAARAAALGATHAAELGQYRLEHLDTARAASICGVPGLSSSLGPRDVRGWLGALGTSLAQAMSAPATVRLPGAPYLINGLTGHLLVEDCGLYDGKEFRPSCLGRVNIHEWDRAMTPPGFWEKVEGVVAAVGKALVSSLLPALGSTVMSAFSDAMGNVFAIVRNLFGESSSLFAGLNIHVDVPDIALPQVDISSLVGRANFGPVVDELQKIFAPQANSIAASVNGLVMMLKGLQVETQYVYAYVGLRESLAQLVEARFGNRAAVLAIVQQALGQCARIRSLRDVVNCDRVRGNIVQIAGALPMLGSHMTERALRGVLRYEMPDFRKFVRPEEITRALTGPRIPGVELAQDFVSKYSGDRKRLLEDWKSIDITKLVPPAMRPSAAEAFQAMERVQEALERPKAEALALWEGTERDLTALWQDVYARDPVMSDADYAALREWEMKAEMPRVPGTHSFGPAGNMIAFSGNDPVAARREAEKIRAAAFDPRRLERWRSVYDEEHRRRTELKNMTDEIIQSAVARAASVARPQTVRVVFTPRFQSSPALYERD